MRAMSRLFWLAAICVSGGNGCNRSTPEDMAFPGATGTTRPPAAAQVPGMPEDRPEGKTRHDALTAMSPALDAAEAAQFAEVSSSYAGTFRGVFEMEAKGAAFFADGQLAYPALTCINPACPAQGKGDNGEPFLFVREFKDVMQGPDGQVIWPANPEITADPVCPACQQNGTIRPFVLPSTARRMEQLKAELDSARTAHAAARQQGLERAAGVRTPREVMLEMESLKQLYLIPRK
jgi:hypothetical protein